MTKEDDKTLMIERSGSPGNFSPPVAIEVLRHFTQLKAMRNALDEIARRHSLPFRSEEELNEVESSERLESCTCSEFSDMIKYVRQEIARQVGVDRDIEDE